MEGGRLEAREGPHSARPIFERKACGSGSIDGIDQKEAQRIAVLGVRDLTHNEGRNHRNPRDHGSCPVRVDKGIRDDDGARRTLDERLGALEPALEDVPGEELGAGEGVGEGEAGHEVAADEPGGDEEEARDGEEDKEDEDGDVRAHGEWLHGGGGTARTLWTDMKRRVGITGLGTICGFGVGMPALWDGLLSGRTSIGRITRFDPGGFPCQMAAEVRGFSVKDFVPKHYRKATKVMARDIELAVGAAKCAVEDAGLVTRAALSEPPESASGAELAQMTYRPRQMGCHIGAGLIAADTEELTLALASAQAEGAMPGGVDLGVWGKSGMDNLTPLWLLKYLPNMLACHVTILHGAEGPSNTITCAEASGLLSVGESWRVIERGAADLCFSGGAESKLNLMGLLRLDLAKRLAHTGDATDPMGYIRPYDEGTGGARGGFVGEGGGIVIMEELEGAKKRGARVYAEVVGFGAAHSSPWYEDGENDEGYRYAVEAALEDAGIGAEQVSAVVPMACGVEAVDRAEAGALRSVFGARVGEVPLVTLSGNVGNCIAGMGGLQAAVAAKCLAEQRLPARLHAGTPGMGMGAGKWEGGEAELEYVLACSGSLGGQNAALVLRRGPSI